MECPGLGLETAGPAEQVGTPAEIDVFLVRKEILVEQLARQHEIGDGFASKQTAPATHREHLARGILGLIPLARAARLELTARGQDGPGVVDPVGLRGVEEKTGCHGDARAHGRDQGVEETGLKLDVWPEGEDEVGPAGRDAPIHRCREPVVAARLDDPDPWNGSSDRCGTVLGGIVEHEKRCLAGRDIQRGSKAGFNRVRVVVSDHHQTDARLGQWLQGCRQNGTSMKKLPPLPAGRIANLPLRVSRPISHISDSPLSKVRRSSLPLA